MSHHAVKTAIACTGGNHNHLFFSFGQGIRLALHQRIVISEKSTKLIGSVCQHQKYVGHKAGLLLNGENSVTDILRQVVDIVRYRKTAEWSGHGMASVLSLSMVALR